MMLTARTLVFLVTIALASGGAAWGVHALLTPTSGTGTDYGLDTNANGKFDWLVVEADVTLPQPGTWDLYADLSPPTPPTGGSCGVGRVPPPVPILSAKDVAGPIAWTYERYFFPAGAQTVRMAFQGTDIVRGGVDGPYTVHARLTLGGIVYGGIRAPEPGPGNGDVEWTYTTNAYAVADFEPPVRPAYFTGGHADSAVDVDSDGLADVLEIRADVHVNIAGHYTLNGFLSKGSGTDVVRLVAYAYWDFELTTNDTSVYLRFRGDQIRAAGVDGPWDFGLTLYAPMGGPIVNGTPMPLVGVMPPQPVYYPETLCGVTAAYRAAAFDDTVEFLRYTGRFEEATPDRNADGTYDALVVRAEVDVALPAGFDLVGSLRSAASSTEVARIAGQTWLKDGIQWVEFAFPGSDIRASGIDGPYVATLSLTPGAWGIDPTTTYTTRAYKAADFDLAGPTGGRGYWIGNLTATPAAMDLAIAVEVVRGNDMLAVVFEDTLTVTVTNAAGSIVGSFKDHVYLPSSGSGESFSYTATGLPSGTYSVTATVGSPDQPVDTRTVVVSL